jgi:hypothetical protein
MGQKLVGWLLLDAGLTAAAVIGLADVLGIGWRGFGRDQVVGLSASLLVAAVGLALVLRARRPQG